MFLTHKKNSLPDLTHGFRDTPSKLGTNLQKICLILRSTSVFSVFAETGGGWSKFFVFYFSIQCYYTRFLSDLIHSRTVRAHRACEQNFFEIVTNCDVINCTYICHFGLHTVFNHVPGGHPTPQKNVFFVSR